MTEGGLARRHALLFAISGLAYAAWAAPVRALASSNVVCPPGSWKLTRILTRGLRDGKAVTVTRDWRVMFTPQSRGIAVSGQQIAVSVDAPPVLARLSEIEKARSTEGMFPILLAPDGMIMAAGQASSLETLGAAIKAAETLIDARDLDEGSAQDATAFFASLQQAGSSMLNQMPGDLFYPSTQSVQHARQIVLPDGGVGEFKLAWKADAQEGSGLLEFAQRTVITKVGDSELRSSEEWRLAPL